jgi:hypothetical protein
VILTDPSSLIFFLTSFPTTHLHNKKFITSLLLLLHKPTHLDLIGPQSTVNSDKGKVSNPNQTKIVVPETTVTANHCANLSVNSAPSVNKEAPFVKNRTQSLENANQTTTAAPKVLAAKNQSASPPTKSDSSLKRKKKFKNKWDDKK